MTAQADALRSLAASLRSGLPPRVALERWHLDAPPSLRPALTRVGRLLALGCSTRRAVESLVGELDDALELGALFKIHAEIGGDSAAMVDALADAADRRERFTSAGAASAAGAVLSGRMIALLPLLFLPIVRAAQAPLFDKPGVLLLATGLAFAGGGAYWIGRLMPKPALHPDGVATVADLCAAGLAGGAPLGSVLHAVALVPPAGLAAGFGRAARLVRLGCPWRAALARAEQDGLVALARCIETAEVMGDCPSRALRSLAEQRRAEQAAQFEQRIRRAPVQMVLPLATCALPAFLLLAVVPFIRGLAAMA